MKIPLTIGNEIKLEEQVKFYKDYWEASKLTEKERIQKEFSEYKLGDTVLYKYNLGYVSKQQEEKYDNDICIAKGVITEVNKNMFKNFNRLKVKWFCLD